ncbi:MAG: substrate-binding domain-containing protein [Deltaproteobacteria bacterium]|nr:substrate-binding domain-containing protein [Candidatus Tharpella sp.]
MIFAAAVFYDVLPELMKAYQEESGIELECEFAGSGKLYQKIVQGAVGVCGADIFLSAAPFYVVELERQELADNVRTFMGNDLVVAVFMQ